MPRRSDRPNNQTINTWRAWLRARGISAPDAAGIVKTALTAGEISENIRNWIRGRKKGAK
jgi:hypothetical protein